MPSDDRGPERNPLVAFRHFVDDQLAAFRSNDPFSAFETLDRTFQEKQQEIWDRFNSSYERATNPERQQIERRAIEKPQQNDRAREDTKNGQNQRPSSLLSKMFGTIGKTSREDEATRATGWETRRLDKHLDAESTMHGPTRIDLPFDMGSIGPLSSLADLEQAVDQARERAKELQKELEIQRYREEHEDNENIIPHQSIYSPLRLEADHSIGSKLHWRQAFEDLMSAERGEPLGGNWWGGYAPSHSRSGWLVNLFWRGHLDYNDPWHQELFGMRPPNYWDSPDFQARATRWGRDLTTLSLYDLFPNRAPHMIETTMKLPRDPSTAPKVWPSGSNERAESLPDPTGEDVCDILQRIFSHPAEAEQEQSSASNDGPQEVGSNEAKPLSDITPDDLVRSLPQLMLNLMALAAEGKQNLTEKGKEFFESNSALADEEQWNQVEKGKPFLRESFDADSGCYRAKDLPEHLQRLASERVGGSLTDDMLLAPSALADLFAMEDDIQQARIEERARAQSVQTAQAGEEGIQITPRPEVSEKDAAQSKILSTLTNIERRVMSDGSTTERRVLKRRFADGHEESEESTETSPAPSMPHIGSSGDDKSTKKLEEGRGKKIGSWFWSS